MDAKKDHVENNYEWYYEINGDRLGPVSTEKIADEVSKGKLTDSTLVWSEECGDKNSWQKLKDTIIMQHVIREGPPPLPAKNINNTLAWALVSVVAIGTIIEIILYQSIDNFSENWLYITLAYCIANSIIAIKDADNIKKSGHDSNLGFWFWLIPVYLYKRAKHLGQSLSYFWSWIGVLIISIVITGMAESSSTYFGVGTPSCSSPAAVNLAKDIFDGIPPQGVSALDLKGIYETNSTDGSRLCQAELSASDGYTYPVQYEITDRGDEFYVELEIK